MPKYSAITIVLAIIYMILLSCSKKQAAEIKPDVPAPENPGAVLTYSNFAQALFQNKCAGCHAPGRSAAAIFNFTGYASVVTNSERIKQAVLVNKTMPLGGSLSAAELQSLTNWFNQGMAQ
ncbi:hypothetical protein DBR11_26900 [Pedobacter sp. HMWF019]|uniref:c-type cytochrome n=1 Tax=Pedobacter sp. HMWF019 TaxID=2056856 RepID=UPI000D357AF1|nr:cytochrome c [Pedobacter sp. HMWF019]PTS92438.1 hypothetical protein DBR11_26900 [Pedobacter sp. HMWF019]